MSLGAFSYVHLHTGNAKGCHFLKNMAHNRRSLHFWKDDETEFLLCYMKETDIIIDLDGRKQPKSDLFKFVADKLRDTSFVRVRVS